MKDLKTLRRTFSTGLVTLLFCFNHFLTTSSSAYNNQRGEVQGNNNNNNNQAEQHNQWKWMEAENRRTVLKLICGLFRDKNLNAIDQYIAPNYIQHSPTIADGREGLKAAATMWFQAGQFDHQVLRVAAEGNLVFVHSRVVSTFLQRVLGGRSVAVVDIFRVERGQILEHWDVLMPELPESLAANNNTMF